MTGPAGPLRCATCGTDEPRSESRFCRVCGAPLAQPSPTSPAGRAPIPKTIPEREPPRRIAPTRVDPAAPMSNPVPYRLSPAPPIPHPSSQPHAPPAAPDGLSFGGLLLRTLVAIGLSVGALLASDQAYEAVKKPAATWVSETFSQDRATARAIVGGGIAVTATLLVTMTVLLVSTRRRG